MAYVDTTLGSDVTGAVQDVAHPFNTFGAAITAILAQPNPGPWYMLARPGSYAEDLVIPSRALFPGGPTIGIGIQGTNAATFIKGSITIDGGSLSSVISDVFVQATNRPSSSPAPWTCWTASSVPPLTTTLRTSPRSS